MQWEYYIYILECKDGSFYTGITNDIECRFELHQIGFNKKCYTYKRRPVELVYLEEFNDVFEAIYREKQIKRWSREKKIALIEANLDRLIELSKNHQVHPSTSSG